MSKNINSIPQYVIDTVEKMLACRNPNKLGYHKYKCPEHPEITITVPHSCKCGFCNTCGKILTDKFVDKINSAFPYATFHHICFTIPQSLRGLFDNYRFLLTCLYKASSQTILSWSEECHFLPAVICTIHTFGKKLNFNVHIVILRPNQVWGVDITYLRLLHGFMYLIAIMDLYSRYVLSWRISNTLDVEFCIEALKDALRIGKPDISNTDQGTQFTSNAFIEILKANNIQISMDSRGRAMDNIFVERLWRSLKYEDIYINNYETVRELHAGLTRYFDLYNNERLHQSLDYKTPWEVHFGIGNMSNEGEIVRYNANKEEILVGK